jgi:hypothetical protein
MNHQFLLYLSSTDSRQTTSRQKPAFFFFWQYFMRLQIAPFQVLAHTRFLPFGKTLIPKSLHTLRKT